MYDISEYDASNLFCMTRITLIFFIYFSIYLKFIEFVRVISADMC
jgi:hypothetical protein